MPDPFVNFRIFRNNDSSYNICMSIDEFGYRMEHHISPKIQWFLEIG